MTVTFALDTSSASTCMAISKNGRVFAVASSSTDSHAESMAALFQKLLSEAVCTARDIEQIIFGSGPGSFTGLRIGLGFVKGLALGLNLSVEKMSSMLALAAGLKLDFKDSDVICILTDARRAECFAALFERRAGGWIQIGATEIVASSDVQNWTHQKLPSGQISQLNYYAYCLSNLPFQIKEIRAETNMAVSLVELAQTRGSSRSSKIELSELEPDYIRLVAAKKISER